MFVKNPRLVSLYTMYSHAFTQDASNTRENDIAQLAILIHFTVTVVKLRGGPGISAPPPLI